MHFSVATTTANMADWRLTAARLSMAGSGQLFGGYTNLVQLRPPPLVDRQQAMNWASRATVQGGASALNFGFVLPDFTGP